MIGKSFRRDGAAGEGEAKGFDDFELRLGDLMRGERATMGKSLLDVQRELKIKAPYIAAIENADPSAFDTPGFIAGYVRSYARYLNLDPDETFTAFCEESGFVTAHGMSAEASSIKAKRGAPVAGPLGNDIFSQPSTPFIPAGEAMFSQIEPRAIGSFAVLVALIGGLGFGGWTVLQEVQKVQFAPVEQTPVVVSDLDPLAGASNTLRSGVALDGVANVSPDALDRLYRPQALDVPVLVARDAPISTLVPGNIGALAPLPAPEPGIDFASIDLPERPSPAAVQVVEPPAPEVQLVAVRPAWVRVRAADGSVIYETIMNACDTFVVPTTEEPAVLRVGESGAVYFRVNGTHYGPAGPTGVVTPNVALSPDSLTASYAVANLGADSDLAEIVQIADTGLTGSGLPRQNLVCPE
ncbi:helix-turn-helix domain-containing protein [Yoonia sediminilitoris]|uniref:Cytoskeletal protein RodZ n=1 Tax=Yoonia sediminilitoris TaxID=1286148 RepID=A0A2T6KRD5_9RHOB|nr:helix-turn-helix domain-containing protein [Yoonia sediminilitoris]PUB19116.1 cytoskeletal protein RodZ [Yoonia sediminilitoris]RCW99284.1 cytoskeletal protein RodZ [Yoonia sediminilitoris]